MKPGAGTTATSHKRQATSDKLQATSNKLQGTKVLITQPEELRQIVARQNDAGAISRKRQATSDKRQAPGFRIPDSSNKRQAPSLSKNFFMFEYPWCIGSCFRPPDTRFRIQEPS